MEGRAAPKGQRTARRSPQAVPLADLQSQLHQLHASSVAKKKVPPVQDGLRGVASIQGAAASKATADTEAPKSGHVGAVGITSAHHDAAASAASNLASAGINFFNGGVSLLKKMHDKEKEMAASNLPASGSHGKPVIKAIQAAEKKRLEEQKTREKKEAHAKAIRDMLAAKKAQKAGQMGHPVTGKKSENLHKLHVVI